MLREFQQFALMQRSDVCFRLAPWGKIWPLEVKLPQGWNWPKGWSWSKGSRSLLTTSITLKS
jgi:hypothetical protein